MDAAWLIFAGGLLSCACIATGFIFFVEKRKHVRRLQQRARNLRLEQVRLEEPEHA